MQRLVTFALAAPMMAIAPATLAKSATANLAPFEAREISPEVHLLSTPQDYYGPAVGNVSVIEQRDGFVLVDSGLTIGNGRSVVEYIKARSAKPVKAVVITHWHNDHPQGVPAIQTAWPRVRVIATAETKKGMLGPALGAIIGLEFKPEHEAEIRRQIAVSVGNLDKILADPAATAERKARAVKAKADYAVFLSGYPGTHMSPPTETFTGGLTISDPLVPIEIKFLGRANTSGDAVVWLPKQKIVMSGDMVVWPTPFGFFSYPADWVQTLGKLKALRYKILIPGHGEPQSDTRYVDQLIGSIEDIRAQVGPLAKAGLPLAEVQKKVDYSRYAALFGTDERRARLFKAYWAEPMTENAWKEAKGIPIVQGEGEVTVAKQAPAAKKP